MYLVVADEVVRAYVAVLLLWLPIHVDCVVMVLACYCCTLCLSVVCCCSLFSTL